MSSSSGFACEIWPLDAYSFEMFRASKPLKDAHAEARVPRIFGAAGLRTGHAPQLCQDGNCLQFKL